MEQVKATTPNYFVYIGLITLGFSLFLFLDCLNPSIAFDDAYSMRMSQRSFADIFRITSQDVHPPLYYWLLKIYSSIFGFSMYAQRIFSNIGILITMLFAMIVIRKRFGDKTAISFIVLLVLFPVTQFLASEIRMYSWAMFFTLVTAVFAYDSYQQGRFGSYLKMGVFALCAAYTHYFALMTVCWIFVLMFFFLWKDGKNKKFYLLIVAAFFCFYLPWLSHLVFQVKQVTSDYWIEPIGLKDIYYHLYYFYSIKKDWLPFNDIINRILMAVTAVTMLLQAIVVYRVCIDWVKKKRRENSLAIIAVLLFLLPILSGFAISLSIRPISVSRYMLCSFGLLLLGLAIAYSYYFDLKKKRILLIGSVILLCFLSSVRYWGTTRQLIVEKQEVEPLDRFIGKYSLTTQNLLGEHYAASALSRMSVMYPDKICFILTHKQSVEKFEPFALRKIFSDRPLPTNFILVQKTKEEGGAIAADFKRILKRNYQLSDSLKTSTLELYIADRRTLNSLSRFE